MEDIIIYKIYRLFGNGMSYYGSTHQPMCERKSKHKTEKNKSCTSRLIVESCDDWDIEIVEICPTGTTRQQSLWRERWWIENNECVNKQKPIRSKEEAREYSRLWAEKKARENGVKPKRIGRDIEAFKAYQKEYMKNLPEEKYQEILQKNKERRKTENLTEEQRLLRNEKRREYMHKRNAEKLLASS
jgi:hypothetical protein